MTDDRAIERAARSWLEAGPTEAPDDAVRTALLLIESNTQERDLSVPWRAHPMSALSRLATAAVIGALVVGAVFLATRPAVSEVATPSSLPTIQPSALAVAPSPVGSLEPLTQVVTSTRYGYTVSVPTGWTSTPATETWESGTPASVGDPAYDAYLGGQARLSIVSQPLSLGETSDEWYRQVCLVNGGTLAGCEHDVTFWKPIAIGGQPGLIDIDGQPAPPSVPQGTPYYDAVIAVRGQGYAFALDGNVDRPMFERLLATVTFREPVSPPVDHLDTAFTSPLYGYRIMLDQSWKVTPTVFGRTNPLSQDPYADTIEVTGTDTEIGVSAAPLGHRTWDQLLAQLRAAATGNVPPGCEGGDPSTWPTISVGNKQGRVQVACNAEWVYVLVGDRVYEFDWGNTTFEGSSHLQEPDFRTVLKTVQFPDAG